VKFGYGINRTIAELEKAGAERCYIDHDGSRRTERNQLFADLRKGDVVILLARGDLGRGREIERLEALIADAGAKVEAKEPPEGARKPPGPKPKFNPTPEEHRRVQHYWQGHLSRPEARRQIEKIMGMPVSDSQLNRHIGPRRPNRSK
jgi:hypothetical protein